MSEARPLRIGIVAGEESGDLLAADLVQALVARTGRPVELVGIGGRHLAALGLQSPFDGSEIALMGLTAVVRDLPRLIRRIGQVASLVAAAKPDCLVTIDSPDFSLRVARKVRALTPAIPIVHYVCPSVWAWRPGRAPAMAPYVDRILCLLPFEPAALERLGGPKGVYVGHRLVSHPGMKAAVAAQAGREAAGRPGPHRLLVLPGSRSGEVRRHMAPFAEAVSLLAGCGHTFEVTIPTVPHVAAMVRQAASDWPVRPRIVETEDEKWRAFGEADAALASSGTVLLELALAGVPMISCYMTDPLLGPLLTRVVSTWSGALPSLVAGWPVLSEYYHAQVRPERLARELEQLWADTPVRTGQLFGLSRVVQTMAIDRPSGEIAAETVMSLLGSKA